MRRIWWSLGLAGLIGAGAAGCGGAGGAGADPVVEEVRASGNQYTVEESAKAGSEGADQFQKDQMKRQAEADKKARGGR